MSQSKVERHVPDAQGNPATQEASAKREAKADVAVRRKLSETELASVAAGAGEDVRSNG